MEWAARRVQVPCTLGPPVDLWALLHRCKADRRIAAAILVPNLAGILFGYYYYWDVGQFDPSSPYFRSYGWWPMIPDSPNAVLLASVALAWYAFWGRRTKWLDALAFTQMMYVGLWTTALFLLYPERMSTFAWHEWPGNANPLLFVSHMAMPLEAMIFLPDLRRDTWPKVGVWPVVAFSVLFVAVDYWGPTLHPAPFMHGCVQPQSCPPTGDVALHMVSPVLMAGTLAFLLAVVYWRSSKSVAAQERDRRG